MTCTSRFRDELLDLRCQRSHDDGDHLAPSFGGVHRWTDEQAVEPRRGSGVIPEGTWKEMRAMYDYAEKTKMFEPREPTAPLDLPTVERIAREACEGLDVRVLVDRVGGGYTLVELSAAGLKEATRLSLGLRPETVPDSVAWMLRRLLEAVGRARLAKP